MIIGTFDGVAESLSVSRARAVKLVIAATPEELLEDFAAARVDWIVWRRKPRLEHAVRCEEICAARPVAASCVARSDSTLGMMAAGWCVGKVVGGGGSIRLLAARDLWLRAWVWLLADGAERAREGGALVRPLLPLAVEGATPKALRESTHLPERTFRYQLSRCGCPGSRRIVMVSQALVAWERLGAGVSCEQVALEAGYSTLSAFDRMLKGLVEVTARELARLPEKELAARLEAGLWREERVAESG